MSQTSIRNRDVTGHVTLGGHGAVPPHGVARTISHGLSDILVAVFLFFASFAFVLWQNAHLTILWI